MATAAEAPAAPLALVTGSTGAFGRHICAQLLEQGWSVIAAVRDEQKGLALVESCSTGGGQLEVAMADLTSVTSIKALSDAVRGRPLKCLINNAATTPEERAETAAGEELQWAVNVLAYHRLTKALLPDLQRAPGARVVFVASFWAGGLNLDDPEFKERRYSPGSSYSAAKQANRMQAKAWASRPEGQGLAFVSCHPGVATSNVSLGLGFDLDRSIEAQEKGARTPVFLATTTQPLVNGGYYTDCKEEMCFFCTNTASVKQLWGMCEAASP